MNISGLQKLSLIDYPGRISCVVFTQGCIFRCSYCHNPELIQMRPGDMAQDEVVKFLESRKNFIEGVCITGGEPSLQPDLPEFLHMLKTMGYKVKLDTSGVNPAMIERVMHLGLVDYFAMDIKHRWEAYQKVVRVDNPVAIENCKKTFSLIQESSVDHEFRTTIFPPVHTEEDFFALAAYLRDGEKYFIQNIRYTKTLDPAIERGKDINVTELVRKLALAFPHLHIEERGEIFLPERGERSTIEVKSP